MAGTQFPNWQKAGNGSSLTATPPLDITADVVSIPIASAINTGALSNTDWSRFDTAASGGITAIGTYDAQTAAANGLTIVGNELFAQSATGGAPGMISLADQVMGDGIKKFQDAIWVTTVSNFFSLGATNPTIITGVSNAASRTFTLPDGDSNPVIPASLVANNWVQYIGSDGVQHIAQPAFSNISGTVNLATQVSGILPIANGGTALSSLGTANQLLGANAGATALEYKTIQAGTAGTDFDVAFVANSITVNLPSASATNRGAVTTTAQSFAGAKTLLSALLIAVASSQLTLGAASATTTFNSVATVARTCTLVDGDSNTVIPANAVSNQFLTNIGSNGVQNFAAVAASGLSGIVPIANGGTALGTTPTNGQLLIGDTGSNSYVLATLTQNSADQVIITNGAGSITLSTPQSINTTSAVRFANVTINGAASGTSVFTVNCNGTNGAVVAGSCAATALAISTTRAPSASGSTTCLAAGGSVIVPSGGLGTVIAVSASTTLSGSNNTALLYGVYAPAISTSVGSPTATTAINGYFENPNIGTTRIALYGADLSVGYTNASPGANNVIIAGLTSFGTSTINTSTGVTIANNITTAVATTSLYGASVIPTHTFNSGSTGSFSTALFVQNATVVNSGASLGSQVGIFVNPLTSSGAGTHPPLAVGLQVYTPTAGTSVNTAACLENLVVGTAFFGSQPPTQGAAIAGTVLLGIATQGFTGSKFEIGGNDRLDIVCYGTKNATDGLYQIGIFNNQVFAPTVSTTNINVIRNDPFFVVGSGVVVADAASLWITSGGQSGAGSVTRGYGIVVDNPGYGTSKVCAWLNGAVTMNTATQDGSNILTVNGGISAVSAKFTASPIAGYVLTTDSSGNGTWQPTGGGGITVYKITDTAVDYAILPNDYCVNVTAVGAPFRSIALPYINGVPYAAPPNGTAFLVKDSSGSAAINNIVVTVSAPGGGTFEGGLTFKTINIAYGYLEVILAGSTWLIVGAYGVI